MKKVNREGIWDLWLLDPPLAQEQNSVGNGQNPLVLYCCFEVLKTCCAHLGNFDIGTMLLVRELAIPSPLGLTLAGPPPPPDMLSLGIARPDLSSLTTPWPVFRKKEIIATLAIVSLFLVFYNGYPQTIEYLQPQPLQVDDAVAQYRHLLSTVNPLDRLPHSKTLGVASRIYLIGLPNREDRRVVLHSLEKAMGGKNIPQRLLY
jgi:hypothetical protein